MREQRLTVAVSEPARYRTTWQSTQMDPSLPNDDPDPKGRRRRLERARDRYRWTHQHASGVPLVARVPLEDRYSARFLARVLQLNVDVATNRTASRFADLFDDEDERESRLEHVLSAPGEFFDRVLGRSRAGQAARIRTLADSLDDYFDMFATIEEPLIARAWRQGPRARDLGFAWQRIGGANPMVLRRATQVPDKLPLDDALYQRAVVGDSLAAAIAQGRLYVADYAMLDGIPNGVAADGRTKYVWAPISVYAWVPAADPAVSTGEFVPVAIQCGQTPGPETPLWSPGDGWRWEMAKTVVQVADGNHHQAIVHLAHTHLTLESFVIAAHRQLSERHPIHILLTPHFEFTLAINDTAANNLVADGGEVEQVLGSTLAGSLGASADALASFRLADALPGVNLRARGLDDTEGLPIMPYRDDTMPVWQAIHAWVEGYLGLYYRGDAAVVTDPELQAWVREVAAPDGGRLPGVGVVETQAQLVDLVAFVIWTASAQHSAVNFAQFDFMGFVPNLPGAGYAPAPGPNTPDTEAAWLAMLTPVADAILQCDTVYQLANIRKNRLGEYGRWYFDDRAVRPLAAAFGDTLDAIEDSAVERGRGRLLPYDYLLPSNITASIHI